MAIVDIIFWAGVAAVGLTVVVGLLILGFNALSAVVNDANDKREHEQFLATLRQCSEAFAYIEDLAQRQAAVLECIGLDDRDTVDQDPVTGQTFAVVVSGVAVTTFATAIAGGASLQAILQSGKAPEIPIPSDGVEQFLNNQAKIIGAKEEQAAKLPPAPVAKTPFYKKPIAWAAGAALVVVGALMVKR